MCKRSHQPPPALVIIGGFAGTGKTAISRRLSAEFSIPRLGSDTLGRTIKGSAGIKNGDAYRIGYDVLFRLCEEYVMAGVSTVLDLTMGWEFQWQHVDDIIRRYPQTVFVPIILCCPFATCIERTRQRHASNPDHYDPPEVYTADPKNTRIWEYLEHLDRPEIHLVDASGDLDQVYEKVLALVTAPLNTHRT